MFVVYNFGGVDKFNSKNCCSPSLLKFNIRDSTNISKPKQARRSFTRMQKCACKWTCFFIVFIILVLQINKFQSFLYMYMYMYMYVHVYVCICICICNVHHKLLNVILREFNVFDWDVKTKLRQVGMQICHYILKGVVIQINKLMRYDHFDMKLKL